MKKIKITYYNLANLEYSSYFLAGFWHNRKDFGYELVISRKIPEILRNPSMDGKWAKLLFSISLFKVQAADREFYFCFDAHDSSKALKTGLGYVMPLLMKVRYYFKVNYRAEEIEMDPDLRAQASKIIPVGPFFPIRPPFFLPFLRKIRLLTHLPSLEEIAHLRNVTKDFDVFFVVNLWDNNQRHVSHNEFRYQIVKEIKRNRDIRSIAGFVADGELPEGFAEFRCKRYSMRDYLRNLARARIAIYVRGLHDCLAFRFGQLLALGMPIVGQTIANNRNRLYRNEHFAEQFAFDEPKRIVEEAIKLLGNPERMRMLGCANARTFDTEFTPRAVTASTLEVMARDMAGCCGGCNGEDRRVIGSGQ